MCYFYRLAEFLVQIVVDVYRTVGPILVDEVLGHGDHSYIKFQIF